MAGTKAGGKRAAETNIKRHGEDFYKRIGPITMISASVVLFRTPM